MSQAKNIIGTRIAFLRKCKKGRKRSSMSQEELGEALNYSREQIGRYERGEVIPDNKVLASIARLLGTTVDYITGETDIIDPGEYYNHLEKISNEAANDYYVEEIAKYEQLKNLFIMCGYEYDNMGAAFDFQDFSSSAEHFYGPHKLTDPNDINTTIYLSDEEINQLKQTIHDTIAFECYRIARTRRLNNGNH